MMHTTARTALELVHELWAERPHTCCPFMRHDERGCYCTSPQIPEWGDSYGPCDTASLQVFCLTETHYSKCIIYPAGDVP